jgi:hypothetical protein
LFSHENQDIHDPSVDFLNKLAALVPRHNLVQYHGVLARGCHQPNAKFRKLIIPKSAKIVIEKVASRTHKSIEEVAQQDELIAPLSWAQRRYGEPQPSNRNQHPLNLRQLSIHKTCS